jgi:hypothetical protein
MNFKFTIKIKNPRITSGICVLPPGIEPGTY